MSFSRCIAWTFLVASGFGLVQYTGQAQESLPFKKSEAVEAINRYRADGTQGIPNSELEGARKNFQLVASYFGEIIKNPLIYRHAQDPSVKDPKGRLIPPLEGIGGILPDLKSFILEPVPRNASQINKFRADYIREMGTALDFVLKPIITDNPEKVVQINATRMLAIACKSGATAHYPTVTELLKNNNTPPYIKHYALVAAGNLLSAYDAADMKSRRHSNAWKNQQTKGAGDKELAELVIEIEKHITDPANIMTNVAKFKAAETTEDQREVVRFIRRQAIRALGELRFAAIPGPDGTSTLYPAYTLARVCISDPTLGVDVSPTECAEAVIGLCNMSSIRDGNQQKDYEVETAVEAVTVALLHFAKKRSESQTDKSIDWRGYGLRLSEALKTWRMLLDYGFNPLPPGSFTGTIPPAVENLYQRVQTALLTPLESGNAVAIEQLRSYLKTQQERKDRKPLFSSNPKTALNYGEKK